MATSDMQKNQEEPSDAQKQFYARAAELSRTMVLGLVKIEDEEGATKSSYTASFNKGWPNPGNSFVVTRGVGGTLIHFHYKDFERPGPVDFGHCIMTRMGDGDVAPAADQLEPWYSNGFTVDLTFYKRRPQPDNCTEVYGVTYSYHP